MSSNLTEPTPLPENVHPSPLTTIQELPVDIASGMVTGVAITGAFHPIDRALYLSMVNKRPFFYDIKNTKFMAENFSQPYHGFLQTIASRAISNSVYFIAQKQIKPSLYPHLRQDLGWHEWQAQCAVGLATGSLTGVTLNGLYATRFQTWNNPGSSFTSNAYKMWSHNGLRPFAKGITATVSRDSTFGIIYEVLRNWGHDPDKPDSPYQFIRNASAAGVATVFSGPFNYVRSVQYASPPDASPPKITSVLGNLWRESKSFEPLISRLGFFHQRLQIGPGTLRVAAGIAASQEIFSWASSVLKGSQ